MSGENTAQKSLPAVDYLKLPDGDSPYLEGKRCKECGVILLGSRAVCANCGARDALENIRLSNRGKLYTYCIVHRSFPGIQVPYISAIVDLEDGVLVKGCLINIDPDPEKIKFDMPVEVVYKDAHGRKDKEGNSYISYFFQPLE